MKKQNSEQRLFEVMGRLDKTFKPKLNEDFSSMDLPVFPSEEDKYDLIPRAIRRGFITLEEFEADKDNFISAASETADRWSDREEIGSSDMTYMMQEFLRNAGIQTDFVNNRLTRINPSSEPTQNNPIPEAEGIEFGVDSTPQPMYETKSQKRLFEVMGRLDKTFKPKLNEIEDYTTSSVDGAAGWARAHAEPDDRYADYGGPDYDYSHGVPEDEYVEQPSVKTEDFKLHGNVEDPNVYLYTVYEVVPNSQFGDALMQAAKYADDNAEWTINYRKEHPDAKDYEYKRRDGIFGHDFSNEDIPRIKEVLNKYTNIKGVPEFMKAMDTVASGMEKYDEYLEKAGEGPYDRRYRRLYSKK